MPAHHCNNAHTFGQKAHPIIEKSNNRFCTACQFGQHCGECVYCKSHHLPLADGIYRVNNREYVGIIGLTEVCWGNYREVSRSYFEMQEAELSEVAA